MIKRFLFLCLVLGVSSLTAQKDLPYGKTTDLTLPEWVRSMYASEPNPETVIGLYEAYYRIHPFVKNNHTQYYKRWLKSLARDIPRDVANERAYFQKMNEASSRSTQWTTIGPYDWDHDAAGRSYAPGSAHIYTIEQAISNPDVLYAGTATTGIWKSTDHGLSWSLMTENILINNCTAIEIDKSNPDIVYVEMLGSVYKSLNGGITWNPTGDAAFQAVSMDVKEIMIHPSSNAILLMASSTGFYRSTDSGANWTLIQSGDYLEIEYHPSNDNIVYTVARNGDITEFYRSTNNGQSLTIQTTGWPAPDTGAGEDQRRVELAVSNAAPDKVYAHATGEANGGSGLYGLYVSNDQGVTWTFTCCGPQPAGPPSPTNMNLMAWSDQGTDDGGQYYYNVAFEVSPTNEDSIFLAGTNLWVSSDEGLSFTCPAKWSHSGKPNYVHADIHDIKYFDHTKEIWIACDGGIFFSNDGGANFHRRVTGIMGTDFWGYGQGYWYGDVMLGGAYHNGTLLKEENTYINDWICTDGGDGIRGFVHQMIDRQAYSDYNIKTLGGDRTLAPATRSFNNKPNASYIVGISSDLLFHPHYYHIWYTGTGSELYMTEDNGYSYQMIHDFTDDIASMAISRSNPDAIYVSTFPDWWALKKIYRSLDKGLTWTEITPTVPNRSWIPYDIEVDPTDHMKLWICRTNMYSTPEIDGASVYMSLNGGDSWTNISGTGLNGESPTNIVHQMGSQGGLYVGTRRAVYYKDDNLADWVIYNTDLPVSTFSTKLVPYYRKAKLRNATNRSVYEVDFHTPNSSVIAQPSVQLKELTCTQDTARFVDYSVLSENGATWLWTFEGGSPATSTERAPKVVFECPGTFDVSLTVTDVNGTDTKVMTDFLTVLADCSPSADQDKSMETVGENSYAQLPDLGIAATNTFTITAWVKPVGIQNAYSGIVMNDGDAGGPNFRESNNTLGYHWPGGSWSWDSNLTVPEEEWSYIGFVVTPTSVTVYVNDESATHNTSTTPINIGTMKIGSYKAWTGRNFQGEIDEVAIWNRALSRDEIREKRHLRKVPENEVDLIAYYSFNFDDNLVRDAASGLNGTLTANASKIDAQTLTGYGVSDRLAVTSSGIFTFPNTHVDIDFASGTVPNGEVVVSRLSRLPNFLPDGDSPLDASYYIINNYGTNQTFTGLNGIDFNNAGIVSAYMASANNFFALQSRPELSLGGNWSLITDQMISAASGNEGDVDFDDVNSITQFGQYLITKGIFPQDNAEVMVRSVSTSSELPSGGKSLSMSVSSRGQGFLLPILSESDFTLAGNPVEGLVAYHDLMKVLVFFDGTSWMKVIDENVNLNGNFTPFVEPAGAVIGAVTNDPSAVFQLGAGTGFIRLPLISNADLMNIETPVIGMLVYNTDDKKMQFYDGIIWRSLKSKNASITVSTDLTKIAGNQGVVIGDGPRDLNAVLQLSVPNKALGIPVVDVYRVDNPAEGLLIINQVTSELLYYNGSVWKGVVLD